MQDIAGTKAFSNFAFYPLLSRYLSGTEASGLYEARLGKEKMPHREVHVFCAAYREDEFDEILQYADHIVFNSQGNCKSLAGKQRAMEKASVCASTPNAPLKKGMRYTTRVLPGAGWVRHGYNGIST